LNLDPAQLTEVGTYSTTGEVTVPAEITAPADIAIRFGLYQAITGGRRLSMLGAVDRTGRVRGGHLHVENAAISWQPEPPDPAVAARSERLNMSGKLVDFGPAATSGAFRLIYGGANWQLIPLPGSPAFQVELRLNQLNANGQKVQTITAVDADGNAGGQVKFQQDGETIRFDTATKVFAYRISLIN